MRLESTYPLQKPVWVLVDVKTGEYSSAHVARAEARQEAAAYNDCFKDEIRLGIMGRIKVERFTWCPRWVGGGV